MNRSMKNRSRERSFTSTISFKRLFLYHKQLTLGTITTLLILPTLFSCKDPIGTDPEITDGNEVTTKVTLDVLEDNSMTGPIDIFTFDDDRAGHLDSYQRMDTFDGSSIGIRSQSGRKKVFICANLQRSIYDWTGINSIEALDEVYLELQKERRGSLYATAEGEVTAGSPVVSHMEMRRMASEIVLQSIRCDFRGSAYEGEEITDVCAYLTNVNAQCPLTSDGHIVPGQTVNSRKLDMDDVSCFAEPDMVYHKMDFNISGKPVEPGISFICYPNTSQKEGPGTPFTRLVIEGKIRGETFWWPIDINRSEGTENPGIQRNSRYVFNITISRKGMKDPDTAIGAEDADVLMSVKPWEDKDDNRVMFQNTKIIVRPSDVGTKAGLQDEGKINDMNIWIFADGAVEKTIWKDGIRGSDDIEFSIPLIKGRNYTIAALANIGRKLDIKDYSEWEKSFVELKEGDGYGNGLPMSAFAEGIKPGGEIAIDLVRITAKISLRMDRSRLSKDVRLTVRRVSIGNCPRYASIAVPSRAYSYHDVFERGSELDAVQCKPLNTSGSRGLSDEVSVYVLENMQGEELSVDTASYVEIEMDYLSSDLISYDSPLIYRFYIEDEEGRYDIERNSHYPITVIPENDGLSQSGWRIDKSGIGPVIPVFDIMPGNYIEGHVGDTIRVWCECYPRTAPFDPGYEELNYDKSRGIYDYRVDDDRHGVTLYLKKPGSGIVYMTAGDPINRSGMALILVRP